MAYKINGTTVVDNSRNVCACCVTSCCITASTKLDAPSGNTASRPASPATGSLYFDTDEGSLISYDGSEWAAVGGAGGVTQTPICQIGNIQGPMICCCSSDQSLIKWVFNPHDLEAWTIFCLGSSTKSMSVRWCAENCCLCYFRPATQSNPAVAGCNTPSINPDNMTCCFMVLDGRAYASQISNCHVYYDSGRIFGTGYNMFYDAVCGHTCCWFGAAGHPVHSKFYNNMQCPQYVTAFSRGYYCPTTATELCFGTCGCKSMHMACVCGSYGQCRYYKTLYVRKSDTCCVPFMGHDPSKPLCCHHMASLANGYLGMTWQEKCSSCSSALLYFFVCSNTGEVTCIYGCCCFCHGGDWRLCDSMQHIQTGLNLSLIFNWCCALNSCERRRVSFVTVSLKGTETCPCFDPTDYTIKCCQTTSSDSLPVYLTNCLCCFWPLSIYGHPASTFSQASYNRPTLCSLTGKGDTSCGWTGGIFAPQMISDANALGIDALSGGSNRKATVLDSDPGNPCFYTEFIPCDYETWGCAYVECCHPATPCPQNLRFVCWAFHSGITGGLNNKWHLGIFESCNCTLSCCKRYGYVALFCG